VAYRQRSRNKTTRQRLLLGSGPRATMKVRRERCFLCCSLRGYITQPTEFSSVKLQRGLSAIELWCECWNIEINGDKSHGIYYSYRLRPPEAHLALNGRNIPFLDYVKHLSVNFDRRITWPLHTEMTEAWNFRTLTRILSLLKRWFLGPTLN
jgi:hypothetical protein